MSDSPKENEARLRMILNALKTLAPDEEFGGMTATQFEASETPGSHQQKLAQPSGR
jgi:hypothetical protein